LGKTFNIIKYMINNIEKNYKVFILYISVLIIFVIWMGTGFFTIDSDEEGIIMRFGRYNREVKPGLNYKLPNPIETVDKISVTRIKKDIIGKFDYQKANNENYRNNNEKEKSYPKESQMLTGDENIIEMHFYVQWKISDSKNYLFNIKDNKKENIVKSAAESVMRQIISEVTLSEALSEKRLIIEHRVMKNLQRIMNSYKSGIEIISIGILYSYVGAEVRDAYRDVQSAKADRERFINEAQAYKNEIIPRAKAEAAKIIEAAIAYKESIISKAYGNSNKFNEIFKAYLLNKDITRRRMYLDTMEKIYKEIKKIIIDVSILKSTVPIFLIK